MPIGGVIACRSAVIPNAVGVDIGCGMGTPSYIVEGLENADSFHSCSHGASRRMGRLNATLNLTKDECDNAMKGIVCDRWRKIRFGKLKGHHDFGEAPVAYKNIDEVINSQLDLIKPLVRLKPLGWSKADRKGPRKQWIPRISKVGMNARKPRHDTAKHWL